jgi:cell division protein FtsB
MKCPFCHFENADDVLVCTACSRDIAIPASLVAERDELLRKRDMIAEEIRKAESEIAMIRNHARFR